MIAEEMVVIDFYVDGACSNNSNADIKKSAMGVGIVAKSGEIYREWSVFLGTGTNQQAEIHAVRIALTKVKDRSKTHVRVHSDSAYVIGLLTKDWKAKMNLFLVEETRKLVAECLKFEMVKVLGHSGHEENERADVLAVQARTRKS